jgi:hypothetical protein
MRKVGQRRIATPRADASRVDSEREASWQTALCTRSTRTEPGQTRSKGEVRPLGGVHATKLAAVTAGRDEARTSVHRRHGATSESACVPPKHHLIAAMIGARLVQAGFDRSPSTSVLGDRAVDRQVDAGRCLDGRCASVLQELPADGEQRPCHRDRHQRAEHACELGADQYGEQDRQG